MDKDLAALTTRLATFADDPAWDGFHTPQNLAMALAGEVGELLAEFQWLTPDQSAAVMNDENQAPRVRAEIGDVMIYLTRLAAVLDIDLVAAANDKLDDSARRYPADRVRGPASKAP